jgi:hypothetical protein
MILCMLDKHARPGMEKPTFAFAVAETANPFRRFPVQKK